ncbi:MAG TPA: hypothetical protein VFP37_02535 [Steroidobacteraceae bacterium]|nr:hypothetical protein [Steroidobacteraceae bacterium]
MNAARCLFVATVLAAAAPLLATHRSPGTSQAAMAHPWPHEFEGKPLMRVPLTAQESRFLGDFPGAVARFTDGRRDILMRRVTRPTRKLHPAEDCYRGWGFEVGAAQIRTDRDGGRWRCFTASRDGAARKVCEQIRDDEGRGFTDVSSWYWSAALGRTPAPWLVVTVAGASAE